MITVMKLPVREIVEVQPDMINAISDRGMRATGKIFHFIEFITKQCVLLIFCEKFILTLLRMI